MGGAPGGHPAARARGRCTAALVTRKARVNHRETPRSPGRTAGLEEVRRRRRRGEKASPSRSAETPCGRDHGGASSWAGRDPPGAQDRDELANAPPTSSEGHPRHAAEPTRCVQLRTQTPPPAPSPHGHHSVGDLLCRVHVCRPGPPTPKVTAGDPGVPLCLARPLLPPPFS